MKTTISQIQHPVAFIIFGATGNVACLKVFPALYQLCLNKLLPKDFYLIGISRKNLSLSQFKSQIKQCIADSTEKPIKRAALSRLLKRVIYIPGDVNDLDVYQRLEKEIQKKERQLKKAILRLFYLALPPKVFSSVAKHVETCKMGKSLCSANKVYSRIIIEKPFGYDLQSAKKLNEHLYKGFDEKQIYRIDHYLGKESFQNILVFRYGNAFFEEHWNSEHISHIRINALEAYGVNGRAGYYDSSGALRDMVQSHLLQFLAFLTMDEPKAYESKEVHSTKANLLKKVHVLPDSIVFGQYKGYNREVGVKENSQTDTYIALKCIIDTPRWRGVPIYIRTGKYLKHKETSAIITFKHRKEQIMGIQKLHPKENQAIIQIAPSEAVSLSVNVYKPGLELQTDQAMMHYCRGQRFSQMKIGDYERLILDVMEGDQTLFTSAKEVLLSWKILQPVIRKMDTYPLHMYRKRSLGPKQADQMIKRDGYHWEVPHVECPFER